ncbi:MAG: anti-sigma factor [Microbacterium sp.]|nr:anti-sigma factor [Microbacterium sp.]
MNEQEFAELSAAAALHALTPDEERRFRSALAVHPEWRHIVRADQETAAALATPVAPVTPPDSILESLLDAIDETSQDGGQRAYGADAGAATDAGRRTDAGGRTDAQESRVGGGSPGAATSAPTDGAATAEPARTAPRRGLRTLFALAACLVLLVGIGFGAVALNGYLTRPAAVVALEQIEGATDAQQSTVTLADGGTATAHWSSSLGKAVLVTEGIATPAEGETYELWFVRGETPVSAGTFDVDGGDATAELRGQMKAGDAIAVTVEKKGGSQTGAPTSDPVIVIPTAA